MASNPHVKFPGDFPPPTPPGGVEAALRRESKQEMEERHANVAFEMDRYHRQHLAQDHSSGGLGSWDSEPSPLSPAERERRMELSAEYREQCGGLPDAPDTELPLGGSFQARLR